MNFELHPGSVLDAEAHGLVVTVDGTEKGLGGNVTLQCRKRWGETWDMIQDDFVFPLPMGHADYVYVEEVTDEPFPFEVVFAASVLDHLNKVNREGIAAVVRSAFHAVCTDARKLKLEKIASPLLKGGWRIHADMAFDAMVTVMDEFRDYNGTLCLYAGLPDHYDRLKGLALSYGLLR